MVLFPNDASLYCLLSAGLAISSVCTMPRRFFQGSCGKAYTIWYWDPETPQGVSRSNICFRTRPHNKHSHPQMSWKWIAESLKKDFIRGEEWCGACQSPWPTFPFHFCSSSFLFVEVYIYLEVLNVMKLVGICKQLILSTLYQQFHKDVMPKYECTSSPER